MAELPKYIMLRKVNETKTGVEYQVVEELPTQSNASNTLDVLTNADRIRAMTDEELADILKCVPDYTDCPPGADDCRKCILDWLRQEAEE